MDANIRVNISLPQSEFAMLKKLAKALGWNLFVQQEDNDTSMTIEQRKELIAKLHGAVQLPDDFDYKKELEQILSEKYNLK